MSSPSQSADSSARSQSVPAKTIALTPLSRLEVTAAILALVLWFLLFSGGCLLGTEHYRKQLASPIAWHTKFKPLIACLLFWTTPNIGLLCCLSAFLGFVGYRTQFTTPLSPHCTIMPLSEDVRRMLLTSSLSAIMRGFGVFTLSIGGLLILATDTLVTPDQKTYLRFAPMLSIISFYVGFNPYVFGSMLDGVNRFIRTEPGIPAAKSQAPSNSNTPPHPTPTT